tara:strand:- start:20026 stop:20214 length:189 start_codon:yes stop_codon:yes gene_type:complete
LNKHKLVTAKVLIDNKSKEVKIIIGKFDSEKKMLEAAEIICEHLSIDFIPDIISLSMSETIH